MKKIFYMIIFIWVLYNSNFASQIDSLSVKVSGDTVYFWNYNIYANCAATFMLSVYNQMYLNTIIITEIDTTTTMADCDCYFDLSTNFSLYDPGHYYLKIYRYVPFFNPGSVIEVGTIEFDFNGRSIFFNGLDFQSSCHELTQIVKDEIPQVEFSLNQNYPNPFNPSTKINYTVAEDGFYTLKVFDILGQEVKTLFQAYCKQGNYNIDFNASNLSSGFYIYQLSSVNKALSNKMILMK